MIGLSSHSFPPWGGVMVAVWGGKWNKVLEFCLVLWAFSQERQSMGV